MSFDPTQPASPEPGPATQEHPSFSPQPVVPSAPAVRPATRRSSGAWLNVVLVVAAVIAVGGVAFAVGRNTAPTAAATRGNGLFGNGNFPRGSFDPTASGSPGGGFLGGLRGDGGFNLSGTVESVTGDTLTIATANGQTLEFSLGADTTYSTKAPATAADVKTGAKVEVQLRLGGNSFRPNASAAPSAGPIGTASSVTVVP